MKNPFRSLLANSRLAVVAGRGGATGAFDGSGASSRRPILAVAALAAALFALVFGAATAQAAGKRIFEETFGSVAQPTFERPQGMAVDYGSGDLYVVDVTKKTLSRWNPDGTPSLFPALGTNVIDGKLGPGEKPCAEEAASCDAESATVPGGFSFPGNFQESRATVQVAIDETGTGTATDGNIYQVDDGAINIFEADGHYLGQLTKYKQGKDAEGSEVSMAATRGPCGVAVDQDGALYVGDSTANLIHKYVPQGLPHNPPVVADNEANFDGLSQPCAMAAGVGPSDGYLFVQSGLVGGPLYKLNSSTGGQVGTNPIATGGTSTVSVFPGSGNVFVGTGVLAANKVRELDASGPEPVEVSFAQPGSTAEGFAVAAGGNRLYLDRVGQTTLEVFGAPLPLPVVVTENATEVSEASATLNGSVNPEGSETEGCSFEYVADALYQENEEADEEPFSGATSKECIPKAEEIGSGTEPVSVHLDLAGLEAGELFHYRLNATTLAGTVEGEEQTFATTVPPTIEGEHATAITESEATIQVLINPEFYETTFHVEYGPGLGLSTPETFVGSDGAGHPLIVSLTDLTPGTTYSWRVVAINDNGKAESAEHAFTTYRPFVSDADCINQSLRGGSSAVLPDCRAYEMVSPIDKNGGEIFNGPNLNQRHDAYIQATPDGAKIAYTAEPAFAGQLSARYYNQYIAARGADTWNNSGINLPLGEQLGPPEDPEGVIRFSREVNAFSGDLCSMWTYDYNATPLKSDAQEGFYNLYRRQNCAPGVGSLETLTTAAPAAGAAQAYVGSNSVQGFSADGSVSFFVADAQLPTATGTPAAATTDAPQLYLHSAGDPDLRLVSVLPNGVAAAPAAGTTNAVGGGGVGNLQNAASTDGTRVFWSANLDNNAAGKLYLRLNPVQPEPTAKTIEVSAGNSATFWDATLSGSAALYSEGTLSGGLASLHRFDVATETSTKLAEKVYGLAGASEDLSRIYLVSGVDHDAAGPAEENQPNLYFYEDGSFTFVAKLMADDLSDGLSLGAVQADPGGRPSRVTPDGRVIVFQSRAPLTGFDNTDAETGEASVEVFTYRAGAALRCVSCNPAGIRPRGRKLSDQYKYPSLGKTGIHGAAWIPAWEHPLHASRVLSGDGNRIFFHSFDPLLPHDNNGTVQDLYQWEAAGTGSCDSGDATYFAQNGGCVDLISSGDSSYETEFFDASEDGSDVFFTTDSRLVPQDPGSIDLYDARVGGGYPLEVTPAPCEGEACQASPPPPPPPTPATAAHRGPGNVGQRDKCQAAARRAAEAANQTKGLRRAAKQAGTPVAANRLHRKAQARAVQAKRKARAVKRCRRANRRAGR